MKFPSKYKSFILVWFVLVLSNFSCTKFVDIELPGSMVTTDIVFTDDNAANSAMIGIYYEISSTSISSGAGSLGRLGGLSADELYSYRRQAEDVQVESNNVMPENFRIRALWNNFYKVLYQCNAMIEGVGQSQAISKSVKDRLTGEALFLRSFCYFNLINLFGDVPLVVTTDYLANSAIAKTSHDSIYTLIVSDLKTAKELLNESYQGTGRTRINKRAVSALLAKVYLFLNDWENAEKESTTIIDDPEYAIVGDLRSVFAVSSPEAIWQIAYGDGSQNVTPEALNYVITFTPRFLTLREEFVQSFDDEDLRQDTWIGTYPLSAITLYYPHKYTLQDPGLPPHEYQAVFRLAEQYLIRAEVRALQDDLTGAMKDLDTIRDRAGLSSIEEDQPGISKADLLLLIEDEKKHELFTEWGNRWFDLKRLARASAILTPIKPGFTPTDELYPFPTDELIRNKLLKQNDGY